jgi:hypothetical protein
LIVLKIMVRISTKRRKGKKLNKQITLDMLNSMILTRKMKEKTLETLTHTKKPNKKKLKKEIRASRKKRKMINSMKLKTETKMMNIDHVRIFCFYKCGIIF